MATDDFTYLHAHYNLDNTGHMLRVLADEVDEKAPHSVIAIVLSDTDSEPTVCIFGKDEDRLAHIGVLYEAIRLLGQKEKP